MPLGWGGGKIVGLKIFCQIFTLLPLGHPCFINTSCLDEVKQKRYFFLSKHSLTAKQKQKYRGMFETQKSGDKTSSGEIGINIRTLASPKVGQDQVFGGVSVLCWHAAAPVANVQKYFKHYLLSQLDTTLSFRDIFFGAWRNITLELNDITMDVEVISHWNSHEN